MAVDGNWNLVMTTPMGERSASLSLKAAGDTLTGTQGADGNSAEIFDGTVTAPWAISRSRGRGLEFRLSRPGSPG
jgi:hypothetical protein